MDTGRFRNASGRASSVLRHRTARIGIERDVRASGRARPSGRAVAFLGLVSATLLLAAVSASAVQWPWLRDDEAAPPVYPEVTASVDWLGQRLGGRGLVVVDARAAASYAAGHVPGSVSLPFDELLTAGDPGGALGALGLTGRGRIVCYGEGTLDPDAAGLFWLLDTAGAESPMLLEGGLSGWVAAGRPTETSLSQHPRATWTGTPRPEHRASTAYVALKFGEDGHEIIDTRGPDAWHGSIDGEQWGTPVRDGHVPHSLPYDFSEFMDTEGRLRDPEETRDIFARVGPRPSTPIDPGDEFIVHGEGGADGAVGYFLLRRAGFQTVRYFPGGWSAWLADPDLPIVRIMSAEELMHRLSVSRRWFRPDAPPESFVFFDVRHWGSHGGGHIPGAVSLTSSFFADSLDVYLDRHWPDIERASTQIVTYCYGPNCIRSRNCSTLAARNGFVNVERFSGGLDAWRLAGGELVRSPAREEPETE